jgi:hypothetical protein
MKRKYFNQLQSFFSGSTGFWSIEDHQQNAPLIVEDAAGQTTFDFYDLHHLYNKCVKSFSNQADEQFTAIVTVALQKDISLEHAFEIENQQRSV